MIQSLESLSFLELIVWCGAVLGGLVAAATALGFALEARLSDSRRIFDLPRTDGQLYREALGTVRFVLMGAIAFAALLSVVPLVEETFFSIATTFFVCWAGFEVYYWIAHRAMHRRLLYRFHRYHHDSRVTSPLTGYSMSTVESLVWLIGLIGVPFLLSLATPISLAGLVAYHALYQVPGNVIGHANVDFFPASIQKRANSWLSHPTVYHSLHHARVHKHFAFGSTFMDRVLGTEWPDWPQLHARVLRGEPLRKLSASADSR